VVLLIPDLVTEAAVHRAKLSTAAGCKAVNYLSVPKICMEVV